MNLSSITLPPQLANNNLGFHPPYIDVYDLGLGMNLWMRFIHLIATYMYCQLTPFHFFDWLHTDHIGI